MDDGSGRPREFDTEPADVEEVSEALQRDEGVDDRRVVLARRNDALVVGGSVASPEEADRALLVAERFGAPVVDRLQVDPALREGTERPPAAEGRPLPSLDPELDATAEDPGAGPGGVDELGDSPRNQR